jgi:hypothetical protein
MLAQICRSHSEHIYHLHYDNSESLPNYDQSQYNVLTF